MISKRVELFRIHREPPLGQLVVEVNGRLYRDLNAIADLAVRGMLRAAAGDFVAFAGGYEGLVRDGMAPPVSGPAPAQPERGTITPLPNRPDAPTAPSVEPAVEPRPTLDPKSLVGQIDAILQQLLAASPEFAGRKIQLRQGIKGGLRIEVDGRIYEQPADITDPAVQQVLRQALQIWESG